jgi:hypothetical protein
MFAPMTRNRCYEGRISRAELYSVNGCVKRRQLAGQEGDPVPALNEDKIIVEITDSINLILRRAYRVTHMRHISFQLTSCET